MTLSILLDTNIIIYREDCDLINENLQKLLKILNKEDYILFIHENSFKDIERDSNLERKKIIKSKMSVYPILKSDFNFTQDNDFLSLINYNNNSHDYVDNSLLYSLYKDEVSFLITEDKGIHKNARKLGIDNLVLSIMDAINCFKESIPLLPYIIKKSSVNLLDINDPIFNKLKKDYNKFESWFDKIKKERRKCLVYENFDSTLGALLIYKKETELIEMKDDVLPAINRIKIATMIVTSTGYKIGELFLKWIINYALENNFYELYLTHFEEEEDSLIYLIKEYGFIFKGEKENGEVVYVKKIEKKNSFCKKFDNSYSYRDLAKKFYPNYCDDENIKKYIIPIKPEFHEKLFLSKLQQTSLFNFDKKEENEIEIQKHTIKKAYISRSKTFVEEGSVVLFYESDKRGISEIGIVEKFCRDLSYEEMIRLVGKRSVYSQDELKEYSNDNNSVMLFIHSKKFNKVNLNKLLNKDIIKSAPQSIQSLSHENYLKLKKLM